MAYVDTGSSEWSLRLDEAALQQVLNGSGVKAVVASTGASVAEQIVAHVEATALPEDAANYVESMFVEDATSDEYGFDFSGQYELGNRPIAVVGIPEGRGVDPAAKPPFMVEADHHALTAPFGVMVGQVGEDIR